MRKKKTTSWPVIWKKSGDSYFATFAMDLLGRTFSLLTGNFEAPTHGILMIFAYIPLSSLATDVQDVFLSSLIINLICFYYYSIGSRFAFVSFSTLNLSGLPTCFSYIAMITSFNEHPTVFIANIVTRMSERYLCSTTTVPVQLCFVHRLVISIGHPMNCRESKYLK
jgi:hypothetical protein